MFVMPSEYTALQSRVKALETIVETLEERIIALEDSPAIQATKAVKQPIVGGFPVGFPVGYAWDNFKPCLPLVLDDSIRFMWPNMSQGEEK